MKSKAYIKTSRYDAATDKVVVIGYRVETYDIPFFRHFWVKFVLWVDPCRLPHRDWYGWVWERLYDMEMAADEMQQRHRISVTPVSEEWARENFDWDIDRELFGEDDD